MSKDAIKSSLEDLQSALDRLNLNRDTMWGVKTYRDYAENYITYNDEEVLSFSIDKYSCPSFQEFGDFLGLPFSKEVYRMTSNFIFDLWVDDVTMED